MKQLAKYSSKKPKQNFRVRENSFRQIKEKTKTKMNNWKLEKDKKIK